MHSVVAVSTAHLIARHRRQLFGSAYSWHFAVTFAFFILFAHSPVYAQMSPGSVIPGATKPEKQSPPEEQDSQPVLTDKVEVRPGSDDSEIADRLKRILEATEWFEQSSVRVEEGVAFLSGRTKTDLLKKWAGDLARNTRDVVAVVNHIEVIAPPLWDPAPALTSLKNLWRGVVRVLPLIVFGIVILVGGWFSAVGISGWLRRTFQRRQSLTPLLREVVAIAAGAGVFLLCLYLVLLVVGLARLAVTVLGGTGLIGLIIGIAFRDITENFLASIFLSIQRPFRSGDLIQVAEVTGLVQRLTVRTTVLMTLDGNHVQVPNSTIYKSTICNYTSNPNRREDFIIGIGYDDVIKDVQAVAMGVLSSHPAVLREPEPWVLVDNLGSSTVNLKIYFWLDGTEHSWLKVRSSVIRMIKKTFQDNGISMPDEAREVIVNQEVPVAIRISQEEAEVLSDSNLPAETSSAHAHKAPQPKQPRSQEVEAVSTVGEGGLDSDSKSVEQQALHARIPEEGRDLLEETPATPS